MKISEFLNEKNQGHVLPCYASEMVWGKSVAGGGFIPHEKVGPSPWVWTPSGRDVLERPHEKPKPLTEKKQYVSLFV